MTKDTMNNSASQPLLAPTDIAKLADVSPAAVSNWRKRSADFPTPAGGTDKRPLFARIDVIEWMAANDKPIVALSASSAMSVLNMLRSPMPIEDAASLLVSLCAIRKLSDEDESNIPLWINFCSMAAQQGFDSLQTLALNHRIDRWDELVQVPESAKKVPPADVATIADLLKGIPSNQLADIADAVLERAVDARGRAGSEAGYIGNRVSNFLARISADDASGVVYDPACGIADVLVQLGDNGPAETQFIGQEINVDTATVARQRAYLHGIAVDITVCDVLERDPDPGLTADLIVADPPYGAHYERYDLRDPRWTFGVPAKSSSEFAWIQHAIAHLANDGIAYVVTAAGSLFRRGRDAQIRRGLIEDGCVRAIYMLPPKLLQHTSIPVAVWVLGTPGTSDTIRFVNADSDEVVGGRTGFENRNPSADVATTDVLAGDANLLPERWIGLDTPDPALVTTEYHDALARIGSLQPQVDSGGPREFSVNGAARVLTIGELVALGSVAIQQPKPIRNGQPDDAVRKVTPRDIASGLLAPIGVAAHDPSGTDTTAPGDVLVSTVGKLAAALDEFGGHHLGTGVVGLRVHGDQVRPDYLANVVNGRWNRRFFTGAAIQRLAIRDLEVPILSVADQAEFVSAAADLRRLQRSLVKLQAAVADAVDALADVARFGANAEGEN